MSYLAEKTMVTLVTVFTEASPHPYTASVRAYLRQCRYADAQELFRVRRQEDRRACRRLGVKPMHLGFVDALWRRRKRSGAARRWMGRLIPELQYLYPVYRRDVVSGRIAPEDEGLSESIARALTGLVRGMPEYVVFAPYGVGSHVDHVIVREVCSRIFSPLVLWSDFPYNVRSKPAETPSDVSVFSPVSMLENLLTMKNELVRLYRTQTTAMFPSGEIPFLPEGYCVLREERNVVWTAVAQDREAKRDIPVAPSSFR
jgi:LmbE family N-acetylglucosaminyl deacetylase